MYSPSGADRCRLEAVQHPERGGDQCVEVFVGESRPSSFHGDGFVEPDPGLASPVLVAVRELDRLGKQIRPQDENRQWLFGPPLEAATGVLGRPHVVRIERGELCGLGDLVGASDLRERGEAQGAIVGEVRDTFHQAAVFFFQKFRLLVFVAGEEQKARLRYGEGFLPYATLPDDQRRLSALQRPYGDRPLLQRVL